jgi:hypothetical protein
MTPDFGQIEWPEKSWLQKQGQALLAWAIFNPHGPMLFTAGYLDNGAERHVFVRSQSPLRDTAFSLGTVTQNSPKQPVQIAQRLRDALSEVSERVPEDFAPFKCIPSLVSLPVSGAARALAVASLRSALAARSFDWGREFYYLAKYRDDLLARAAEEAREALELWRHSQPDDDTTRQVVKIAHARFGHLPPFAEWQRATYKPRAFSEPDFQRWLDRLTTERFFSRGFFHFAQSWIGTSRHGPTGRATSVATGFDDLLAYLRHFRHRIWPADWSASTVQQLGSKARPPADRTKKTTARQR